MESERLNGVGERVGWGERKEEGEEEEVVEVEGIFRAAPNQLLRQFVSVGVKARGRDTHTSSTLKINMQPTRFLRSAAKEEEKVNGRAGKRQDKAETVHTTEVEDKCFS